MEAGELRCLLPSQGSLRKRTVVKQFRPLEAKTQDKGTHMILPVCTFNDQPLELSQHEGKIR